MVDRFKAAWGYTQLLVRVVGQRGLPIRDHNIIPALQAEAANRTQPEQAAAATRLLSLYKDANLCVYDIQKHGVVHALGSRVRQYRGNGPSCPVATSSGTPSAAPESRGAKVAFVITGRTRERLAALGHSKEGVKKLRPADALIIAEEGVGPDRVDEFLSERHSNLRVALKEEAPPHEAACAPSIHVEHEKEQHQEHTKPAASNGFDMSAVRRASDVSSAGGSLNAARPPTSCVHHDSVGPWQTSR